VAVLLADDPGRLVQLREVLREAAAEVRGLVVEQAAAVLAQVERVEVPAALDEEFGQVGLEEIVDPSVYVQDGAPGRGVRAAADQRRHDRPLVVGAQVDGVSLVRRAQDFVDLHADRLPARSTSTGPYGGCPHSFSVHRPGRGVAPIPGRSSPALIVRTVPY
jgi:hypothetical protein